MACSRVNFTFTFTFAWCMYALSDGTEGITGTRTGSELISVCFVVYRHSYSVNKVTPTKYVSRSLNPFSVHSQHTCLLRKPTDYV